MQPCHGGTDPAPFRMLPASPRPGACCQGQYGPGVMEASGSGHQKGVWGFSSHCKLLCIHGEGLQGWMVAPTVQGFPAGSSLLCLVLGCPQGCVISGMCVQWLEAEVCARGRQHPVILHRERISPCRHIPKGAGPQPHRCCARSYSLSLFPGLQGPRVHGVPFVHGIPCAGGTPYVHGIPYARGIPNVYGTHNTCSFPCVSGPLCA